MRKSHKVTRSVRSEAQPPRRGQRHKKGFTLIEIIVTIVIWSVLVIPIAFMVKEHIIGTAAAADIAAAYNLARLEMSKVNNLAYTDATLADGYNNTTTDYEGYRYDLNRTVNYVAGSGNNLKKVTVTVYESGTTRQLAMFVTYVADVNVGPGSGGGAAGGGLQADYLVVSGGNINGNRLRQIDMQNTNADEIITVSKVTVSWTSSNPNNPASLTKIEMDGITRWDGTETSSGTTVVLTTPFPMAINTFYNNTGRFTFSENISSATLIFIMSDDSSSSSITW